MQELINELYEQHKLTSSWPCETVEQFVAEFKEDIYFEALERGEINAS